MNVQTNIQKTAAEEALGIDLPTRRVESFHYTDLRSLLREVPDVVSSADTGDGEYQRLVDAARLPFYDGHFFVDQADDLPKGVTIKSGIEKPTANSIDDTLVAINSKAPGDAIEILIEGNDTREKPLGLAHVANSNASSACFHKVVFSSKSEATVIDRYISPEGIGHLSNVVTDLDLGEGAVVNWFIIQQENTSAIRLARLNATLAKDATLNLFILNAGGKLVRQEVKIDVTGEGAHVAINGINLVGDDAHIDVTTILEHNVPNTTATELFRNVVAGDGRGIFQGQIKVAQIAQKTDAQMACNTLLLTDEGDFSAKPELEIFADDVICAHGATVTDIDEDQLFYLLARGIGRKEAQALLIKAFVDEVVEDLDISEALNDALIGVVEAWLDANA